MPHRRDHMQAAGRDLKWLVAVIVFLLVAAGLIAPFVGRAAVRLVKEFFNGVVFPGGVLLPQ